MEKEQQNRQHLAAPATRAGKDYDIRSGPCYIIKNFLGNNIMVKKPKKEYKKKGPVTGAKVYCRNPIIRGERIANAELSKKIKNTEINKEIYNQITLAILSGNYSSRFLFDLSQEYQIGIAIIRAMTCQCFNLIDMLQSVSDNTEDSKKHIKADIDQKLHMIFDLALKKKDFKTCNNILLNIGKLYGVYDPEKLIVENKTEQILTKEELEYIKTSGKLPQSVLKDINFATVIDTTAEDIGTK